MCNRYEVARGSTKNRIYSVDNIEDDDDDHVDDNDNDIGKNRVGGSSWKGRI